MARNKSEHGEVVAMRRPQSLLPETVPNEGVKVKTLQEVLGLNKIGFNLVKGFFCENIRTKGKLYLFKVYV